MSQSKQHNEKVLKFLNDHGYKKTEKKLAKEQQFQEEMLYFTSLFKVKSSSLILNKNIAREFSLDKQFLKLKEFVNKNDEIYCGELNQILFPIFCYSYLTMIKQTNYRIASLFLKKFENIFFHSKDKEKYQDLCKIKKAEDMQTNTLAKNIVKEKFLIVLSKESFELLLKFFEDNGFFMFKSFSNRYINFIISSNLPADEEIDPNAYDHDVIMKDKLHKESLPQIDEESEEYSPSVLMYTIFNKKPNVAKISKDILVTGYDDSVVRVDLLDNSSSFQKVKFELVGHSGPVFGVDITKNNNWILSTGQDSTVKLWNVKKKKCVAAYRGHQYVIWDAKFSIDEQVFATCSHDKTARLWVTNRITPVRIFAGHVSDVDCIQFHPSANFLATGSSDKTIRLFDVQNGRCVRIFTGSKNPVTCLAFTLDGNYVVSGGETGEIAFWDLKSGKRVASFLSHFAPVTDIVFQNNKHFVSSCLDFSVKVWDYQKKKVTKTFHSKNTPVLSMHLLKKNLVLSAGFAV